MAHVLLYGPGDLGERIAYDLISWLRPGDRLTLAGRPSKTLDDIVRMAQMKARALNPGLIVEGMAWRLEHADIGPAGLTESPPDVAIFTATLWTWWKRPRLDSQVLSLLDQAGFGVWLPLQAALLLRFAAVLSGLGRPPWLVIGPYPDVTAVLVKSQGFDRVVGFGNVDELAIACPGEVRLVAHHAVERALFSGQPLPCYRLWTLKRGRWQRGTLRRPFEWPQGTRSHVWTAASAVRIVAALLRDRPTLLHVPGPLGLPGGYPVWISRQHIKLALPETMTVPEAVAVNQRAAQADGIAHIGADGRVTLTDRAARAVEALLKRPVDGWGPDESDWNAVAQQFLARIRGDSHEG